MATVATYLPVWSDGIGGRSVGDDEDALTMAVAAGRAALADAQPSRVVFVSRQLPLLEGGNAAALLGGLGLCPSTDVVEQVGGAPAALDAVISATSGTLVLGADAVERGAGAGAWWACTDPAALSPAGRFHHSLPLRARGQDGVVHEDDDPRLQRERGTLASLDRAQLPAKPVVIAGLGRRDASAACAGDPPVLPTFGASSPFFALAALVDRHEGGLLAAVEQASATAAVFEPADIEAVRDEVEPIPKLDRAVAPGPEIKLAFTAYDRAFTAKLRWEAARCSTCDTLAFPPRLRCIHCGTEGTTEVVALPRTGAVYTTTTVHVPVPGLRSPYSLAVVQLDGVDVRALVHVTDDVPGAVDLEDRGRLVLRRVAVRQGVPDYGYAFAPDASAWVTSEMAR